MSVSTGGMPSLEGRSYVTAAYNVTSTSKATNIFGNNQEPSIFNYDYTGSSYNETTTFDINNIESI